VRTAQTAIRDALYVPATALQGKLPHTAQVNPLKSNDHYSGRTAPLTSKRCILYIYSTNIGTEYFKHGIYYPVFFSSKCSLFHNSNVFGSCIIHILYTKCAKIKKNNSGVKRLRNTGVGEHITIAAADNPPDVISECNMASTRYVQTTVRE